MDSEDDAFTSSTNGSVSPMTTDNETETEDEENNLWMPVAEQAMQTHKTAFKKVKMNLIRSGLDKQFAGKRTCSSILPEH